ncbi:ComF family protein [Brachybacterium hainanense]|uniref:ComF family protein n=1 Tax=Brachybacterium hainanense TaxID=1541174 RepID=A0ABV6RBX3_9MICO
MSAGSPPLPPPRSPSAGGRSAGTASATGLLRRILFDTCALVLPLECPCGQEGTLLCPACRALLHQGAQEVQSVCDALQHVGAARVRELGPHAPAGVDYDALFPVLALGEYAGPLQRLVVEWKNRGAFHRTAQIADALAPVITALLAGKEPHEAVLVPVPSRLGSRIRRGEDHMRLLARELSQRTGVPVRALHGSLSGSQAGKGSRQRRHRRFRVAVLSRPRAPAERDGDRAPRVILLDDVVTTGATLRAVHEGAPWADRTLAAVVVASARWPAPPRPGSSAPTSTAAPGTSAR